MPYHTTTISLLLGLLISSSAWTQVIDGDRYYSIIDSALTLHGTFDGLAGIETISVGGFLSLESQEIPNVGTLDLKYPFPPTATILENAPGTVVLGVLGSENRVNIQGATTTAIRYARSSEIAVAGDLTVNLGMGDDPPARLLGIGEDPEGNQGGGVVTDDDEHYVSMTMGT